MCVYVCVRFCDCTPCALKRTVVAVKYRTLFNLMLQSLAGFLSANYKQPHGLHLFSHYISVCFSRLYERADMDEIVDISLNS